MQEQVNFKFRGYNLPVALWAFFFHVKEDILLEFQNGSKINSDTKKNIVEKLEDNQSLQIFLGYYFRSQINLKGISISDLSQILKIPISTLRSFENGDLLIPMHIFSDIESLLSNIRNQSIPSASQLSQVRMRCNYTTQGLAEDFEIPEKYIVDYEQRNICYFPGIILELFSYLEESVVNYQTRDFCTWLKFILHVKNVSKKKLAKDVRCPITIIEKCLLKSIRPSFQHRKNIIGYFLKGTGLVTPWSLKNERMSRAISLEEIAISTKISLSILSSYEKANIVLSDSICTKLSVYFKKHPEKRYISPEEFERIRKAQKFTYGDLVDMTGYSKGYLQNFLKGVIWDIETFQYLTDVFMPYLPKSKS